MRIPLIGGPGHETELDIDISIPFFDIVVMVEDQMVFKVQYEVVRVKNKYYAKPVYEDWLDQLLSAAYRHGRLHGTRH